MVRDIPQVACRRVGAHERSRWCRMRLRMPGIPAAAVFFATFHDQAGEQLGPATLLVSGARPGRTRSRLDATCFVPAEAALLRVRGAGLDTERDAVPTGRDADRGAVQAHVGLRGMSRVEAAVRLGARDPRRFGALLLGSGKGAPDGWKRRVRHALAMALAEANRSGLTYTTWLTLFDTWKPPGTLPAGSRAAGGWPGPSIGFALVVHDRSGAAAMDASLQGIAAQWLAVPHAVLDGSEGEAEWRARLAALGTDYVGIVGAGEVLPPHAAWVASRCLRQEDWPDIALADEDALSPAGERHAPLFKPTPDRLLMLSGTLSRGLWLVRADLLARMDPAPTGWAEALRLELWLRRWEAGSRRFSARIPYVLVHRRHDAEAAPAAELAGIVNAHLRRTRMPMRAEAAWPVRLHRTGEKRTGGRITVVIPSTLRRPHSLECISAVLERTDYPELEVHVAVSQPLPLDPAQQEAARRIEAAGRAPGQAKVTWLRADRFNFSWVNNQMVARTAGENVLLLNDDVSPIRGDWLDWMASYLADDGIGIVGARLLYPSGDVQHGGVIMGLGGLCDHAHRHLPRNRPGYGWRAVLPQELSAVTAACMLVRRRALQRVGGLDEAYPSAFNDVDLALRIGELGYSVAYAPQAELFHYELQTYGDHYAGERAPFFAPEVERMQRRWAEVCAADPYHNPNLSLENGHEWRPAFPPRVEGQPAWPS